MRILLSLALWFLAIKVLQKHPDYPMDDTFARMWIGGVVFALILLLVTQIWKK